MVSIRSMLAVHFMNSIHGRTCRHSFFQGCEWLAYIGGRSVSGKNLFRKKEQEFKCPVSEGLAFAILFEAAAAWHCISRVPRSHPKLFLLCDVLHALQLSATGRVNADDLEAKICRRMRKYVEVYGPEEVLPRGHFALHLAGSLRHHEILLSCFVHERRRRSVKQIADQLDCILRPVPKSMSCKWLWRTISTTCEPILWVANGWLHRGWLLLPRCTKPFAAASVWTNALAWKAATKRPWDRAAFASEGM